MEHLLCLCHGLKAGKGAFVSNKSIFLFTQGLVKGFMFIESIHNSKRSCQSLHFCWCVTIHFNDFTKEYVLIF